ncbi:hypothetical protein IGI37_002284 [Enterococcus sp. AZ194]|uniref:hypothetical protein n=1 Tax=Enterococcus sp. AZ194 TaxID=2774629 RepID=UPI003F2664A7
MKNIDDLAADAAYLGGAIRALDTVLYHHLNTSMTVDKINEINGMVEMIKCFSEKHEIEIDAYSMEGE